MRCVLSTTCQAKRGWTIEFSSRISSDWRWVSVFANTDFRWVRAVLSLIPLGDQLSALLQYGRWPLMLILVGLVLACLYRWGPSRATARWRWVSWGSAFASITWLGVSALFSWYVANFGNYNETYGSLGAVVGFMTWIWLSVVVVLVGAELNAEMEHQTARDTTHGGREKPLGRRGAVMADRVGPAQD